MLVIEKVGILHVVVKDATKVEVLSKGEFFNKFKQKSHWSLAGGMNTIILDF